jgi:methionine aminopeptidase
VPYCCPLPSLEAYTRVYCAATAKLNATVTLVNGDYLSSDMCFLLLGYMADQVVAQPVSLLAAMPSLAVAIVNQTKASLSCTQLQRMQYGSSCAINKSLP